MKNLNIGIIGYGARGRELEKLFSRPDEGIHVVAVADAAVPTDLQPGIRAYDRAARLFDDPAVNAIVITTPDYLHESHASLALRAGKHVYLEKPMATTPGGCNRILAEVESSGRVLYIGHNLRHFTVVKKLKEVIDSGAIGEVKAVWCRHPVSYGRWAYFQEGRWHKKREKAGGLLIHKGAHDIDVIHWLAGGRTKRVVAMGTLAVWGDQPGEPDVEDLSSVLMRLDNGVQATYQQCHFAFRSSREYMIHGTKGTLQNDGDQAADAVVRLFGKRGKNLLGEVTQEWCFSEEAGFHGDADKRITDEFIGIVRGTTVPTISIEDAAWAVKTGYAATQSLRKGNIPIEVV